MCFLTSYSKLVNDIETFTRSVFRRNQLSKIPLEIDNEKFELELVNNQLTLITLEMSYQWKDLELEFRCKIASSLSRFRR
jgi:hypothetical protein